MHEARRHTVPLYPYLVHSKTSFSGKPDISPVQADPARPGYSRCFVLSGRDRWTISFQDASPVETAVITQATLHPEIANHEANIRHGTVAGMHRAVSRYKHIVRENGQASYFSRYYLFSYPSSNPRLASAQSTEIDVGWMQTASSPCFHVSMDEILGRVLALSPNYRTTKLFICTPFT